MCIEDYAILQRMDKIFVFKTQKQHLKNKAGDDILPNFIIWNKSTVGPEFNAYNMMFIGVLPLDGRIVSVSNDRVLEMWS
jgi:hypothetical protein